MTIIINVAKLLRLMKYFLIKDHRKQENNRHVGAIYVILSFSKKNVMFMCSSFECKMLNGDDKLQKKT